MVVASVDIPYLPDFVVIVVIVALVDFWKYQVVSF